MRKLTLLGPLAAALLLVGLFEDNIETSRSDASIRAWLSTASNGPWLAHSAAMAIGGVLLTAYAGVLRHRLSTPASPVLAQAVGSLGTVLGSVVVVGAGLFAAVPVGRFFEQAPDPDPSSYRYLLSAAASLLVVVTSIPAAAFIATVSALGLRTRAMPRWLSYTGLVMAVLVLASTFVAPLMVFGLWLVVSGVSLSLSRVPTSVVVPVPA